MLETVLVSSSSGFVLFLQVPLFPLHHLMGMLMLPVLSQLLNLLASSSLGKLRNHVIIN